jgi:hypothetical protein
MTVAALEVAESFGLSETELIHQALVSFLQERHAWPPLLPHWKVRRSANW